MKKIIGFFFALTLALTANATVKEAKRLIKSRTISSETNGNNLIVKFPNYNIELEFPEQVLDDLGFRNYLDTPQDIYDGLTKKLLYKVNPLVLLALVDFHLNGTIPSSDITEIEEYGFNNRIEFVKAIFAMGVNKKVIEHDGVPLDLTLLQYLLETESFADIEKSLKSQLKRFNSVAVSKFIAEQRQIIFAQRLEEGAQKAFEDLYANPKIKAKLQAASLAGKTQITIPMHGNESLKLWHLVAEKNKAYEGQNKLYIGGKKGQILGHDKLVAKQACIYIFGCPLLLPFCFGNRDELMVREPWILTISLVPLEG